MCNDKIMLPDENFKVTCLLAQLCECTVTVAFHRDMVADSSIIGSISAVFENEKNKIFALMNRLSFSMWFRRPICYDNRYLQKLFAARTGGLLKHTISGAFWWKYLAVSSQCGINHASSARQKLNFIIMRAFEYFWPRTMIIVFWNVCQVRYHQIGGKNPSTIEWSVLGGGRGCVGAEGPGPKLFVLVFKMITTCIFRRGVSRESSTTLTQENAPWGMNTPMGFCPLSTLSSHHSLLSSNREYESTEGLHSSGISSADSWAQDDVSLIHPLVPGSQFFC